jgi:hypothetical protein
MAQDEFPQSHDEHRTAEPAQGSDGTGAPTIGAPTTQSRRKFLVAAVAASGAAAVVAGAGTAMATGLIPSPEQVAPRIINRIRPATTFTSPIDPSFLCLEKTQLPGSGEPCFNINNGHASPGDFWLFFTIRAVAPGDYLATFTQSTDGGVTQSTFTTASTPFQLDNSQAVHVTVGGTLYNCPTSAQLPGGSPGGTSSSNDPVTVPVATSTQDVQVAAHIKWEGGSPGSQTITFNAQLTSTDGNTIYASPSSTSIHTPCP